MTQPASGEQPDAEDEAPTVAPAYSTPPPEGLPSADDDSAT